MRPDSPIYRTTHCRAAGNLWLVFSAALTLGMAVAPVPRFATAQDHVLPLEVAESWHIDHPTHHVQGLAMSDEWFWISSVDRRGKVGWICRVDRDTLKVVAERKLVEGNQFHPGGIQLAGDDLWVPLAEYRPASTSTMLRLDPQSLATRSSFAIDDHIGGVAVDPGGIVYAANWDCRLIYEFDNDGKLLDKAKNPTGVAYQDIEWHDRLLVGTGRIREDGQSVSIVDVIDPENWRHVRRYKLVGTLRSGGSDFGREGFTKFGDGFYLLPEDGPHTTVYRFPLTKP